jgi:uncharacterized protein
MRVIIPGGTGLIGRALAADLSGRGDEVVLLSRKAIPAAEPKEQHGVSVVQWDARSAAGWGHLVDGADAIINLAGEPVGGTSYFNIRWTPERKRLIPQSRIDAGKAVIEAVQAAIHTPRVIIQASAVGYYGTTGALHLTEESPAGMDFLASVCKDWEASTEKITSSPLKAGEQTGIRRAVVRIGVVLSSKGGALPRQVLPFQLFAGGPIGSGRQGYSWIHLADVVGALRFILDTPTAEGVFNLTAPQPLTNAQFGRTLAKVLHRPYWLPVPGFAFKIAFGEASTILLDGQMVEPAKLLRLGYTFKYPNLELALGQIYS